MKRYVDLGLLAAACACVAIIALAYVALGVIEATHGDLGMGIMHIGGIVVAIAVVALYAYKLRRAMAGHP